MPCSFALMGVSVSVSWNTLHFLRPEIFLGPNPAVRFGLLPFVCQILLLLACAWTGGFIVGSISRRTLWASAMLCASPDALLPIQIRYRLAFQILPSTLSHTSHLRSPSWIETHPNQSTLDNKFCHHHHSFDDLPADQQPHLLSRLVSRFGPHGIWQSQTLALLKLNNQEHSRPCLSYAHLRSDIPASVGRHGHC